MKSLRREVSLWKMNFKRVSRHTKSLPPSPALFLLDCGVLWSFVRRANSDAFARRDCSILLFSASAKSKVAKLHCCVTLQIDAIRYVLELHPEKVFDRYQRLAHHASGNQQSRCTISLDFRL